MLRAGCSRFTFFPTAIGTCGKEASGNVSMMLVTPGSLSLPFAWRMALQAKKGEMLSTEEWQRNHQLLSHIYTSAPIFSQTVPRSGRFYRREVQHCCLIEAILKISVHLHSQDV